MKYRLCYMSGTSGSFSWLVVKEYKLLSPVLHSFLQIHFTFPILSTTICLRILIADP